MSFVRRNCSFLGFLSRTAITPEFQPFRVEALSQVDSTSQRKVCKFTVERRNISLNKSTRYFTVAIVIADPVHSDRVFVFHVKVC